MMVSFGIYFDIIGIIFFLVLLVFHFRIVRLIRDKDFLINRKNQQEVKLYQQIASRKSRIGIIVLLLISCASLVLHIYSKHRSSNNKVLFISVIVLFLVILIRSIFKFKSKNNL
jgi:hypothetical protein